MTAKTDRRFSRIIDVLYIAIILGLAYLFIKYCTGVIFPFLFAFFVAMIVQKPTNACYKKIKKGKGIISTFFVLVFILILAAVVSLLGAQIVASGKDFVMFIRQKISDFPALIENIENWALRSISFLPDNMEAKLSVSITDSLERFKELTATEAAGILVKTASTSDKFDIKSLVSPIGGGVWNFVKGIPSVLIAGIISIVASCFMAADYDRLVGFLKHQLNEKHRMALSRSKAILFQTLRQLFKAYGTIMFFTFLEMLLGLYILKLIGIYDSGYMVIVSIITAIVDIFPVLGTGTIVVPWAVYCLITGDYAMTIGLVIIYVIILVLRQIIEPKLVANRLGLPPVLTIAAMYIGTQLFGVLGIFLLPIICIMVKRLNDEGILHLWKNYEHEPAEDSAGNEDNNTESEDSEKN